MVRVELARLRELKELDVSEATAEKLLRISPATIDRLLRPKKQEFKDRRRYSQRGANLILSTPAARSTVVAAQAASPSLG